MTFAIMHKPVVSVTCPACKKRRGEVPGTAGVLCRATLSRLEEGLGHEGFRCNACGHAVKYVPKERKTS